jgi:hypothetical protein
MSAPTTPVDECPHCRVMAEKFGVPLSRLIERRVQCYHLREGPSRCVAEHAEEGPS